MARWNEQERPCPHGDTSGLCDRGGCDEGWDRVCSCRRQYEVANGRCRACGKRAY